VDRHAAEYLGLAASLGALDSDFLDDGGNRANGAAHLSSSEIARRARALLAHLRLEHGSQPDARVENLALLLDATAARADLVGDRATRLDRAGGLDRARRFDEDLLRHFNEDLLRFSGLTLRDGSAPGTAAIGRELDALLPGTGGLTQRLAAYEARFVVRRARLHAVLTRAIEACRAQTARHIVLPGGETLATEYVAGTPWGGESVYQGRFRSVLRVNRGFAFPVDRLLTLACHEGYPGHHTYETLRDGELVRGRGWTEFSATPLFTPQGFTAEAIATAAAAMAFTRDERLAVLRDELFPLAAFDPGEAAPYARVMELVEKAAEAIPPILGQYLGRNLSSAGAAGALQRDAFMTEPAGTLAFADRYGAYSLAYTLGADLAMTTITADARTAAERWHNLRRLILSPVPLRGGRPIQNDEGRIAPSKNDCSVEKRMSRVP
jgi:hypothetical protein